MAAAVDLRSSHPPKHAVTKELSQHRIPILWYRMYARKWPGVVYRVMRLDKLGRYSIFRWHVSNRQAYYLKISNSDATAFGC